ncbi:MAG: 4Fe-4S binding protein [Gemmatimonadetes bacterium]|nr:4Fe-4S binding protein [Gemmatimonadota bacterium]
MSSSIAPRAQGRVLPTMNEDGSRRWIRPKPSDGAWWSRRRIVAYVLMVVYLAIPHIDINGKPSIWLNAVRREFTFFGYTFLATDTLLFMLLLGTLVLLVFTFTALFGRVWCGWGCPQTVWMEFVFRPLERLIEGGRSGSMAIDRAGRTSTPPPARVRGLLRHRPRARPYLPRLLRGRGSTQGVGDPITGRTPRRRSPSWR